MMAFRLLLLAGLLLAAAGPAWAQTDDDSADQREHFSREAEKRRQREQREREKERERLLEEQLRDQENQMQELGRRQDDSLNRSLKRFFVRPGEKIDLVFNTGYLFTGELPDSVPASPFSGSIFVGISANWVINKRWALKIQPGITFYKLVFDASQAKKFPTATAGLESEKVRAFYFDVPIGVAFATKRRDDFKLRQFAEVGATVGYLFETSYKATGTNNTGQSSTSRVYDLPNVAKWRVALYGKYVWNFVGIWALYRLTDVFESGGGYDPANGVLTRGTARYPSIPRFEIGFNVTI